MSEAIRIGGLMRCCILTLQEREPAEPAEEGDVIQCRSCSDSMIFRDGAWEWLQPESLGQRHKT